METTTIIKGRETILTGIMPISYEVELCRKDNEASLYLWAIINEQKNMLASAYGSSIFDSPEKTYEESLACALDKAQKQWNIEVNLKEVA